VDLGINLSFAVKRWPEPEAWARIVREDLGLTRVQFTFDLLDPWWPDAARRDLASRMRRVADAADLTVHSAFVGLAAYTYNGLLHPEPVGRAAAREWWLRAIDTAAAIGASAVGGPLGGMSIRDAADPDARARHHERLLEAVRALVEATAAAGLREFLVEPTLLSRELPHAPDAADTLLADLGASTAARVRYVLDVGHAGYRPFYGPDAGAAAWLDRLGGRIGLIHLQNHDHQSDAHWGWPHPRGDFDLAAFARVLAARGLGDAPVFLELFYPFEEADDRVLANVASSVRYCQAELSGVAANEPPAGGRVRAGSARD